jgi:hypothetical protein
LAPHHPASDAWDGATEAMYSDVGTTFDTDAFGPSHSRQPSARTSLAKPAWLLDAEDAVQKHLGPGRSSHDFLHADRTRRSALRLASHITHRAKMDLKVIELASLFVSATNDPKHPIRDAKEFVVPWSQKHHSAVSGDQVDLIVKICRAVSVKKEERRKREKRETDWHRSCLELHVVQDADVRSLPSDEAIYRFLPQKLEQLGCIGILRCVAAFHFEVELSIMSRTELLQVMAPLTSPYSTAPTPRKPWQPSALATAFLISWRRSAFYT